MYVRYAFCSSMLRIVKIEDEEIRKKLLKLTWKKVYTTFPSWKKNPILRNKYDLKSMYLRTINKFTFKMYSNLLYLAQNHVKNKKEKK